MTKTNRESISYHAIVAKQDNEYLMLDDVFKYSDDFMGATGSRFRLVSKEEYKERTSREALKDYKYLWQEAVQGGNYDGSWSEYLDELEQSADEWVFDTSYSQYHDDVRAIAGVSEEDYPAVECTGGGRMFEHGATYDVVYRQDLLDIINQYEKPNHG